MKNNKNELWYLLIGGQQDSKTGIVGNFYAYGDHLGEALEKAIQASTKYNFSNHNLAEASLLDGFDIIENKEELEKISEDVYMQPKIYSFSFDDPDKDFIPPIGIVKSVYESEYEYDLIKENFVAYGADDNGVFEFELVLTKQNLIDTFIKTIDFLPTIDGFWIYIKDHWENEMTELWVAKHFIDKQTILNFLKINKRDILENGYLKVVIHSLKGETNLTLDDHKKIQLHTNEEKVFSDFIGEIIELGYEQTSDFYNLEYGYHHYHYRPANSLTRSHFKEMLIKNNFELIDKY